ncbi:FAS1 domain-containing protein [Sporormia fimetaria CBS 119925]|uniref:FAS1 domain-containing protein n=1 Tax=Sporormia fimetaria CBS 119925 TaxID=1340428 RepID=A0A6A6VG54_9PLEO|nr:FAS1 domain-containing protein [Sporormia fimetaria CBS 119925]
MRFQQLLPVLPLASALVITEQSVFENIEKLGESSQQLLDSTRTALDDAIKKTSESVKHAGGAYKDILENGYDVSSWLESSPFGNDVSDLDDHKHPPDHDHPHHPPGNPHHPPHHGDPHHGDPHHPPHDEKPNMTIYELISKSKYTTKLTKLINEYSDLVDTLNSTKANYTIFAPTDAAFDKIPEHHPKPSKEVLKDILLYHVSDSLYPAGRVLHSYTIPTLYTPTTLGGPQRLTVRVTLRGPTINFYSKLVATNIFATNGVIHGVDSLLVPPPNVATIINLLPGEFSTLELGLTKTGLFDKMNSTDYPHQGGTLFAPSNFAWQKLGARANAFLFSKYGEKYLKALLEYHMVVNQTLYTDAFYDPSSDGDDDETSGGRPPYYHYDLQSVLGKNLAVDVARYGPFVSIRVNGFSRVTVHDGVASDGNIQVVSNVIMPPKNVDGAVVEWEGQELSEEELVERLTPLVEEEENLEL